MNACVKKSLKIYFCISKNFFFKQKVQVKAAALIFLGICHLCVISKTLKSMLRSPKCQIKVFTFLLNVNFFVMCYR